MPWPLRLANLIVDVHRAAAAGEEARGDARIAIQ